MKIRLPRPSLALTLSLLALPSAAQSAPGPAALSPQQPGTSPFRAVAFDRPGDGRLWVRGRTYKASFGPEGATYIPFLGSDAARNYPVRFELVEVTQGGVAVPFERRPQVELQGQTVVLDRGSFEEVYAVELDSMEQMFRFDSTPGSGELRVTLEAHTELAKHTAGGAISFENPLGTVTYSSAFVVDASGSRIPVSTRTQANRIELRVPAATLASLEFPITVDPVISTHTLEAGAPDTKAPDVAYDESTERYLVAWSFQYSVFDYDIWCESWSKDGTPVGDGAWMDSTTEDWRDFEIANNNRADTFLLVAERGPTGYHRIGGRFRTADGSMGPQIYLDSPGYLVENTDPSVGGDSSMDGDSTFCVAWARDHDGDKKIVVHVLHTDGSIAGGMILGSGDVGDITPAVSRNNGAGDATTRRWNVVWQRTLGDPGIWGVQFAPSGLRIGWYFQIDDTPGVHWPTVSPPLDREENGEHPYLVAYERASGDAILCSLMRASTKLETVELSELQGLSPDASRIFPHLDSDGEVFLLTFCQPPASVIDYDVFASTIGAVGGRLTSAEGPVALGTGEGLELLPRIATTYSGGGARRSAMCIWNQQPSAGEYDISAALYESVEPPIGIPYCEPTLNSVHALPVLSAEGSLSIADADLTLHVEGVPPGAPGIFYFGRAAIEVPFGDGKRCVGGATQRMFPFVHGDCAGRIAHSLDFSAGYASSLTPGETYWQLWYRDPTGGPAGFNLSGAWQMTLVP